MSFSTEENRSDLIDWTSIYGVCVLVAALPTVLNSLCSRLASSVTAIYAFSAFSASLN